MGRSRYWVMKHGVGVNGTQGRLLHMSHPIFMVLNPMFCDVSPKIVIFHELLIVETCNKCHWIQHALNPKYMHHSSHFNTFFPVKNPQNVKLLLKLWCFLNCLMTKNWKTVAIWHASETPKCVCKPLLMHFCQSKIHKMWNFCLKLWLFRNCLCRDLKPVALDLACLKPYICTTQAISMHFSQLKSTKCEILAVS